MSLLVKKLHPDARLPELAHEGEDIGYDVFALEDYILESNKVTKIRTGIAIEFAPPAGAVLKTRSSMASLGINVVGGVLDAGWRGEILVMLTYDGNHLIRKGDKIAQMIRTPIAMDKVFEVEELTPSSRGERGFGSSGK